MKTNKEKLNDAVGMLDEETVQSAMAYAANRKATQISRRATMRRRAAVLLAACLSLALMLGALLAIPLMTAEQPTLPETQTGNPSTLPATREEVPFGYTEASMVRLSLLRSDVGAEVTDTPLLARGATDPDSMPQLEEFNGFFWSLLVMSFDCEPGETVTVHAQTESLHYVGIPYNRDTDLDFSGDFMKSLWKVYENREDAVSSMTIDPATSCIVIFMPHTKTALDEDTLSFTVQNEDNIPVGAGSVYVGMRYLVDAELHRLWYDTCTITRSAILGSVRFNTPEDVTAEQVSELLESFTATTEEVKASLDYTPVTMDEHFATACAEIVLTEFVGEEIHGLSSSHGNFLRYYTVKVDRTDKSDHDRGFLILADGTWGEYRVHDECWNDCHGDGCPNSAAYGTGCSHALTVGCRITLLDGRVFEFTEQEIDGKLWRVPVEITKTAE